MSAEQDPSLAPFLEAVQGKKAEQILMLDVRGLTSIADTFIICSGRSNRQVAAIADNIHQTLKQKGIKALGVEGKREGLWVLLDYGHVLIHIFHGPVRSFYDLEGLWADARQVPVADSAPVESADSPPVGDDEDDDEPT